MPAGPSAECGGMTPVGRRTPSFPSRPALSIPPSRVSVASRTSTDCSRKLDSAWALRHWNWYASARRPCWSSTTQATNWSTASECSLAAAALGDVSASVTFSVTTIVRAQSCGAKATGRVSWTLRVVWKHALPRGRRHHTDPFGLRVPLRSAGLFVVAFMTSRNCLSHELLCCVASQAAHWIRASKQAQCETSQRLVSPSPNRPSEPAFAVSVGVFLVLVAGEEPHKSPPRMAEVSLDPLNDGVKATGHRPQV
jgi:hypothetical protein